MSKVWRGTEYKLLEKVKKEIKLDGLAANLFRHIGEEVK